MAVIRTESRRRKPVSVVIACALVAAVLVPSAALASQVVDDSEADITELVRVSDRRLRAPASTLNVEDPGYSSRHAWLWSKGGRAFMLADPDKTSVNPGWRSLVAHDLETGEEVARSSLQPRGWFGVTSNDLSFGRPNSMAVDEEGGRLFVAFQAGQGTTPPATARDSAPKGNVCLLASAYCFAGLHVVDATTLESRRSIWYQAIRTEAGAVGQQLLAMRYSPPRSAGDSGKVHLLIEEMTHWQNGVVDANPRFTVGSVVYAVQFDPETGTQDWSVRVDACRGPREKKDQSYSSTMYEMPHPAAIFRSSDLETHSVIVACHNGGAQGAAFVRIPLGRNDAPAALPAETGDVPGAASTAVEQGEPPAGPDAVVRPADQQLAFFGPERTFSFLADPASERILARVVDGDAEVWWVFDAAGWRLVGTVGIGKATFRSTMSGIDEESGRLYVLAMKRTGFAGGLYVVDVRRTPLPQALHFPQFADMAFESRLALTVEPSVDGGPRRIYLPEEDSQSAGTDFKVLEDHLPVSLDVEEAGYANRTLDLDEVEGVTSAAFDGTARGYGARVLLVGGVDAATRLGPADPVGQVYGARENHTVKTNAPLFYQEARSPCTEGNRDITFGFVGPEGPAVVDASGARGGAEPVVVDTAMRADLEAAGSRCTRRDWDAFWSTALFGRAPIGEPTVPWPFSNRMAQCVATSEDATDSVGDPVSGMWAAKVDCAGEEASGYSYARGLEVQGVRIGEALSSFRVYRDNGRGIVSRVESVARGISIPGVVRIDTVRGVAESWANGREFSPPPMEAGAYKPNCDFERTAGTCFTRHIFGVWTPGYSCGPCGDEATFADRVSKGMGANGSIRLRQPDQALARGAENGFIAAITKLDHERFSDLVLNNDLLQTVLPSLEIIRYAPPNRSISGGGPRGRQIIQLAGVEVASSYGISCLLVFDEATNTCGAAGEPPGSIAVSLTDADGKALAGGAFEVRQDADTDGVVGLKDALLPDGACVTADDGVGTCTFDALQPGSYLVSQVAAPPGYGKVADPFVVELASGEARTVTFQNTSNVSTIQVSAAEEAGTPVSRAVFAVYPDADSDGKVAADAQPAATCTTDASGSCSMQVPAGSYVLVQTSAPGGLELIAPVAFTFASGGQTAAVGVVNYPAGGVPAVESAASPVEYSAPPAPVVTETVDDYQPVEVADEPQVSVPEAVGGTIVRVIQAPGDALRLLTRDPKQAVAWIASLLLFALAVLAIRRRQAAVALIASGLAVSTGAPQVGGLDAGGGSG